MAVHVPRLARPWLVNLIACLSLMAMAGNISVHVGQDASFDLKNYHWYNAYAYLGNRLGQDIAPAMLQSFLNPLVDVPYFLLATSFPDYPGYAAFLQGSYYGLLVFILAKLALHLFGNPPDKLQPQLALDEDRHGLAFRVHFPRATLQVIAAVAVGASGTATLSQFGTTSNEIQISVLVMAGIYLLVTSLGADHPTRRAFLAGAVIGAAAGLKLTAAPYVLGASAAFGHVCWRRTTLRRQFLPFLLALATAFLLLQGPWSLRLYQAYDNPLFPLYNHLFASEWWETSPLVTASFFPRDLLQWFFYPLYWVKQNYWLVMDGGFRDARIATAFLGLVILQPGLWRDRHEITGPAMAWHLLTLFFLVSYTAWLLAFSTYRYLVPLEMLSGILLVGAWKRVGGRRFALSAMVVATGALLAWSRYPDYGHTAISPGVVAAEAPRLQAGALVLLLGDAPMSYVAPSFQKDIRFIGVGNNFLRPGMENRLQRTVDRAIGTHRGAIYFMETASADRQRHDGYLTAYGLQRTSCQPLPTTLEPFGLQLCLARRQRS